ncbi:hypothetical protein [Kitasatospora sp. NPDC004289]
MALENWEHDGEHFCLQSTHVADGTRYFELSEARPTPAQWTTTPTEAVRIPGPALVTVTTHQKDEEIPPLVHFDTDHQLPLAVLSRFVARVTELLKDESVEPRTSS